MKTKNNQPALVWKFEEAPLELQKLSTSGGDEDWLVELPPGYDEYGVPTWIGRMSCSVFEAQECQHPTKPGWKVYITTH